jgi:hypothetical protein
LAEINEGIENQSRVINGSLSLAANSARHAAATRQRVMPPQGEHNSSDGRALYV